ncbi:inosamine-phosphate amidinotransferase 1 [Streptacidiphilus sp. MAP5-3]|uniref:inosamine-phosphate amidinotransferase 1 n=1 Tax=unclassified Streptacidiphilus TaxID=2643834 RepID=UPI003514A350
MSSVRSFTDFGTLREIVVGSPAGFHVPDADLSLRHFFGLPADHVESRPAAGALERAVEETEEDLQALSETLVGLGVTVRRPDPFEQGRTVSLLDWATTANHALMPRDCLLVVGERIIEAPMAVRARYAETFPFRRLVREYFDSGAIWVAAPRPQLPDSTYEFTENGPVLAESEPLFDAANLLRCGSDLFFNVSNTGNRLGAEWLRRLLGAEYTVHEISICDDHIGTTLHILRPGVLLANAGRLSPDTLPEQFRGWKVLWFDEPQDDGFALTWPRASTWIGMNILAYDEETIIVPARQEGLARMLEKEGFTAVPVPFRHGRTFGGGFHCCTLDVRRDGSLASYL